jgi:hypothetical protein
MQKLGSRSAAQRPELQLAVVHLDEPRSHVHDPQEWKRVCVREGTN